MPRDLRPYRRVRAGRQAAVVPVDRNGLEVLSRAECLELLARKRLGRVAVSMGALPVVVPVNYALLDGDVVFRTGTGTKLDAAVTNMVVAFEVDDADDVDRSGWSVLVTGIASEVTDADEADAAAELLGNAWLPVAPPRIVRVRADLVSGRRIPADPSVVRASA